MRSPSRLLARIEALELALKPKGRIFVFVDLGGDAASYEEREAAFRAEKGVGPGDELHSVRVTWDDPAEEPPGRCRTTRSGSLRGAKRRMRRLGSRAGSIRVERRVRVRDLGILDVEPILPVGPRQAVQRTTAVDVSGHRGSRRRTLQLIGDPSQNLPYAGNERERPPRGGLSVCWVWRRASLCGIRLTE
jgi:hypothetical protein